MTTLKGISEFELISRFAKTLQQTLPDGTLGIGDDCAILPQTSERSLLVTTDLLVEGVHFLFDKISARDLGHKALAVNLSDIAAMGGKPTSIFLSLALPASIEVSWLDDFFAGLRETAERFHVAVLGGDTTRSEAGLTISMTALGEAHPKCIKLRSSAREGQIIAVTGTLGDSAAGLLNLRSSTALNANEKTLVRRHHHPEPAVLEGEWLGQLKSVTAMMDLSDGLTSDLPKILEASKRGARVSLEKLPLSTELQEYAGKNSLDVLELAASGGEDYKLLLTIEASAFENVAREFAQKFGSQLHAIGEVTAGELIYLRGNEPYEIKTKSFAHFG